MPLCYGKKDSLLTYHWHGRTLAENDHVQISHRQTSLVTLIARYVGVLENAHVTYLPATDEYRTFIGLDHFVHAHMMREGPGNSVFMFYLGYEKEFELPCPKLSLYSVKRLTL